MVDIFLYVKGIYSLRSGIGKYISAASTKGEQEMTTPTPSLKREYRQKEAIVAMMIALQRIAAGDKNNTQFAVLAIAEARAAIEQANAAGIALH